MKKPKTKDGLSLCLNTIHAIMPTKSGAVETIIDRFDACVYIKAIVSSK